MPLLDQLRRRNAFDNTPIQTPIAPMDYGSLSGVLNEVTPFIHQMRDRNLADMRQMEGIRNRLPAPITEAPLDNTLPPWIQPKNKVIPQNAIIREGDGLKSRDIVELGFRKEELGLKKKALESSERLGEERLETGRQKQELDELKNKQIYETKILDMDRKATEAEARMKLLQDSLAFKQNNAEAIMAFNQAKQEAAQARFELQMAQKDKQFDEEKRLRDARIAQIEKAMEESGQTFEETEIKDEKGNITGKRTRVVKKGEAGKKEEDPLGLRK